jgi:hypothetical protein
MENGYLVAAKTGGTNKQETRVDPAGITFVNNAGSTTYLGYDRVKELLELIGVTQ